jgi:hypothetical protein
MININIQDLLNFISLAVSAGVQDYIRGTHPERDYIKQAEAKRYLKSRGYRPVMLRKWSDYGLLHPVKTGEARNSPTLYSLAEIKKVISTVALQRICHES